jgi:nitroreductase
MTDAPDLDALIPALAARRSLRAFAPDALDDATLRRLFEAARWAPSSGNGQPWRFVLTRAGTPAFDALAATLRAGNAWAREAPVLLAAAVKTVHDAPGKPERTNRRALLDLGLALQNLLLQAAEEGLIGHPMAGFDAVDAADVVGLPDKHEVVVLVALGRPGDPAALAPEVRAKDERPRTRLPLAAIVFEGAMGRPAAFAATADDEAGP